MATEFLFSGVACVQVHADARQSAGGQAMPTLLVRLALPTWTASRPAFTSTSTASPAAISGPGLVAAITRRPAIAAAVKPAEKAGTGY